MACSVLSLFEEIEMRYLVAAIVAIFVFLGIALLAFIGAALLPPIFRGVFVLRLGGFRFWIANPLLMSGLLIALVGAAYTFRSKVKRPPIDPSGL